MSLAPVPSTPQWVGRCPSHAPRAGLVSGGRLVGVWRHLGLDVYVGGSIGGSCYWSAESTGCRSPPHGACRGAIRGPTQALPPWIPGDPCLLPLAALSCTPVRARVAGVGGYGALVTHCLCHHCDGCSRGIGDMPVLGPPLPGQGVPRWRLIAVGYTAVIVAAPVLRACVASHGRDVRGGGLVVLLGAVMRSACAACVRCLLRSQRTCPFPITQLLSHGIPFVLSFAAPPMASRRGPNIPIVALHEGWGAGGAVVTAS